MHEAPLPSRGADKLRALHPTLFQPLTRLRKDGATNDAKCTTSAPEEFIAALALWQVAPVRTPEVELPVAERCLRPRELRARLALRWVGCLRRDAARPARDAAAFRAAWAGRACR